MARSFFSNGISDYKRYPVPFSRGQLRDIFLKHDRDGDGKLSRQELASAFNFLGSNWSYFRASRSLAKADSNDDGYITLDELDRLLDYAVRYMSLYEDIPSEPEPLNYGDTDIEVELDELYRNIPSEIPDSSVQNEEPPSSTFNELDFEIIDSIYEEGSRLEHIGSSSNDYSEIYNGAMFESKKDLQHVIKRYCLTHHYQIVVVESNQDNWYVKCKKWNDGCTWRLRACWKKIHGLFEITKIEEPHSCIYPQLTHDHS